MKNPKAIILCDSIENITRVFGLGRLQRLKKLAKVHPVIITGKSFDHAIACASEAKYIFSTWGMPVLEQKQIDDMKKLKAVFYAAGSVKYFAAPYLKKGIKVISAWAGNAKPTAAFAFSQILLSCKGYFRNSREYKSTGTGVWTIPKDGIYMCKIGILGAGQVGRKVIEMLRPFGCEIYIYDPYLTVKQAKKLGARKAGLKQIFKECLVVSNHMPDLEKTKSILDGSLFSSMQKKATLINTGRGAQVCEDDLAEVLVKRKDLTALLDVTCPEPPEGSSKLFSLPNIIVSPHIAGAYGKEQVQLADCVIDEFEAMLKGRPLKYEVKLGMLKNMG